MNKYKLKQKEYEGIKGLQFIGPSNNAVKLISILNFLERDNSLEVVSYINSD
jgi:hypothetical protein